MLRWLNREVELARIKQENRRLKDLLRRCALNHWMTDEMSGEVGTFINDYLMSTSKTDFYGRKFNISVRVMDEPASPKA